MHHKFDNMRPETEFGNWLYSKMVENDLTCTDVAEKLHVSKQTIAYHTNGKVCPNYPFVLAYNTIFGDDVDEVWNMVLRDEKRRKESR